MNQFEHQGEVVKVVDMAESRVDARKTQVFSDRPADVGGLISDVGVLVPGPRYQVWVVPGPRDSRSGFTTGGSKDGSQISTAARS